MTQSIGELQQIALEKGSASFAEALVVWIRRFKGLADLCDEPALNPAGELTQLLLGVNGQEGVDALTERVSRADFLGWRIGYPPMASSRWNASVQSLTQFLGGRQSMLNAGPCAWYSPLADIERHQVIAELKALIEAR